MDEHLSYITLRGARKRDHPQSFSYHEPWWEAYHMNAQYLARLSAVMSQGEQINKVLVIEPTTTAWMYQGNEAKLREIGDSFFNLLMALEAAQIEYDLGCEDVIARHGSVGNGKLKVGQREYEAVLWPPGVEGMNQATAALLDRGPVRILPDRSNAGPRMVGLGTSGEWRVDGQVDPERTRRHRFQGQPTDRSRFIRELIADDVVVPNEHFFPTDPACRIERIPGDKGILFHHRRVLEDGQVLLLVNTSIEHSSQGVVRTSFKGLEWWNLQSGEAEPYPFVRLDDGASARFDLPPSGSLLLLLTDKPQKREVWPAEHAEPVAASGAVVTRRVEPNVLTLDYVDVTAGGETRRNQYFYAANQFAWQKNGTDRNPWDSAVQFKDELIAKTFPAGSGFEASYRFTLEGAVPENLELVLERPDLYTITCNGQPVAAAATPRKPAAPVPGAQAVDFAHWWLDKAFGCLPLARVAKPGENVVTLRAAPFTIFHELEPAYLRGDFALKPAAKGFVVVPDRPLTLGSTAPVVAHSNNPDGTMWLSGGIGFTPGVDDRAPFVLFDLGRACDLESIQVWNYCEGHVTDLSSRGAKTIRVLTGPGAAGLEARGTFELRREAGQARAQELAVKAAGARFVKFEFLANHAGVTYPVAGEPADNGFVGLAEVQFQATGGATVKGATVSQVSGELASHRRVAKHLLDASGLVGARPGWNEQGHPFYAHGVGYRQQFKVAERKGRFVVALPAWYGSVARVDVNGKAAGYIVSSPWELDVTKQLKRGDNTIEVVVFGTLKNTLGPHHGGHALGSAWPGMFQNGPKDGPPPGEQYASVGYGLFEPFVLKRIQTRK
jgi:hypothetical protein